jgi:bifunctional DNase/RNase
VINKHIPKRKLDKSALKQLHTPEELERISLKYDKMFYHPQTNQIIIVMKTENKSIGFALSEFEGAMASFIFLGCSLNAHIKTIYDMYIGLLAECGSKIECSIVESMHGDIYYSTIEYLDKNGKRFRNISNFTDAMFLSVLSGAPMYILRKVENESEDFTDWTYLQDIADISDMSDEDI